MAAPIAFESSWKKKAERENIRQAREKILEKAKNQYEREQLKKEQAKLRGEDTWMLPALSDRIDQEQKDLEKAKSKKTKKEKKKKHKKEKKKKKKKKEASDSDSDSDSDDEPKWIEKTAASSQLSLAVDSSTVKGPSLQRDNWMSEDFSFIPTTSREQLREQIKKEKEEQIPVSYLDQPGQHSRELNPYWKDGGTGLPEEAPEKTKKKTESAVTPVLGAGGVAWLKKAYQRCVEQAEEEGRPLEELVAERYGSLKKLQRMIAEAEKELEKSKRDEENNARDRETDRERDTYRDRDRDRYRDGNRDRDRDRERDRDRDRGGYRDRERDRERIRDRDRYKERRKSRSRSPYSRDSREAGSSRLKGRFMKPGDLNSRSNESERSLDRDRKRFLKPGESSSESNDRGGYRKSGESNWRKREFQKPGEGPSVVSEKDVSSKAPSWKKEKNQESKREKKRSPSPSESSSSSTSSSSESESEEEVPKEKSRSPPPPAPRIEILTEQQMNELGAKLLKAELMGNQELADQIKEKMEASRAAKELQARSGPVKSRGEEEGEEDNVVVLTRTDRSGMVRPIDERQHEPEGKGKRRKKQKMATHDKSGERERYFADDDKYDLKTLVKREKLGTAEDDKLMFARLAGRSIERTDDEYQIDDVFVGRANKVESEAKAEERERNISILENRRLAETMSRCQFCFDKVPKHLIIAIGIKVYLCLPNHQSLTTGHCQIVPMSHVSQATVLDEDVWSEIQIFRKGLTKMFEDRDEDAMFLETSMNLRRHPHVHIDCIPLPKETGDLAPIYFKKAIQEVGPEWAQNKKLVDLSQKDIRHAVPKGFPYFSVDFGLQGGFAHVIEDEQTFPSYFGQEIIGGMMDLEPRMWRKPFKENFEDQRKKVLEFANWWKPYDWTQRLKKNDDDDDDD
ncbi:CWF19-like protein 2 [Lingula anatina]|uniref:CWF19-like protein 2 n=1 Tax=Lingula anatina TaxID=7574 RepID=A0A1S3I2S6_LINAN|nr:CWF19-like protein 2 [Lingula anatina]|eukprot:XP_013392570.1 CWF19-like protein 2 [Lingula anatina]